MAFDSTLKKTFDDLPKEEQNEVIDFMMFLSNKTKQGDKSEKNQKFPFDGLAGGLKYISEDFDETPEGFEEYT